MRAKDAFDICYEVYVGARQVLEEKRFTVNPEFVADGLWRPDYKPKLAEYLADFALAGERGLGGARSGSPRLASRLILFRVYYLGRAPYHQARRHLGISELTWSQWAKKSASAWGGNCCARGCIRPGDTFGNPPRTKSSADSRLLDEFGVAGQRPLVPATPRPSRRGGRGRRSVGRRWDLRARGGPTP